MKFLKTYLAAFGIILTAATVISGVGYAGYWIHHNAGDGWFGAYLVVVISMALAFPAAVAHTED